MELVALKVQICLKSNNQHDFPPFNELPGAVRDNVDWSIFVDRFGGWQYDQICGHQQEDETSSRGCWNGMLFIPEDFADAAVKKWPNRCTIVNETEAEKFYEERAHVRDPEIKEDPTALQAIVAKTALGIAQEQGDIDALDPDHPAAGRRRNSKKTFVGFKSEMGITVKAI